MAGNAHLPRPVLLYSGTWKFCRWAARVVARLDRREELGLLSLADDEAASLLADVAEEARAECWWLILRNGTPIAGDASGGVALFAEVKLTRPLARAIRALHASALIDALDKVVARQRGRLGRLVPEGPAPRRYP
jgi:predicted DCC family thiol-disulfide oxidoreductase YuxK